MKWPMPGFGMVTMPYSTKKDTCPLCDKHNDDIGFYPANDMSSWIACRTCFDKMSYAEFMLAYRFSKAIGEAQR